MNAAALTVSLGPVEDQVALGRDWRALEQAAGADASFFLSWAWIGGWLALIQAQGPMACVPDCLTVREPAGAIVGLALLCRRRHRRLGLLSFRQWWLNQTGDPALDALTIEYNGILAAAPCAPAVRRAALGWLARRGNGCDELILGGIESELAALAHSIAPGAGRRVRLLAHMPCPGVDLAAVRAAGGDPLTLNSASTRSAIRRAMRLYGADGPLTLEQARSAEEGQDFLSGLKQLHQEQWRRRGQPGAFARPGFERFHQALVQDQLAAGTIQLCRIAAGARTIGFLYNFLWRGRVHAYQSGFAPTGGDPRLKPGLVSHTLAIGHAAAAGHEFYDFMAGDGQHKRSLATGASSLWWLALEADDGATRLVTWLRRQRNRGHTGSP